MATGGSLLTYTPPGSTDVKDRDETQHSNSTGLEIKHYLRTIRLRLDIKSVAIYSISGAKVFEFETMNDGEHVSKNIQSISIGTYYAVTTKYNGNHEYQSLIQY